MTINNPVIRGFNPDPSIVRVGDDYYIATSTFEWYPGVQIFHSRDLQNWTLVARPLNRPALLDLRGVPDSCGVWAPGLSYADGRFWLCYTVVRRFDGDFKDTHNFITSCEAIDGEWSDPVFTNSSGFDPSLFHDDDGRKWLVNMVWDHRPDRTFFRGIALQEFDAQVGRLIGDSRIIFEGSPRGLVEGPHIYKRNGWYYLMVAEGGTGYDHAVTLARCKALQGPYEADPSGPFISARDLPGAALQRCGHGSLVETPSGDLFVAHLASRPLSAVLRRSPTGRETAIQKVVFNTEGWLRLDAPQTGYDVAEAAAPETVEHKFQKAELPSDLQWLRTPYPSALFSLTDRPGHLRLIGRESIGSSFEQSLVARRQTEHAFSAETELDFDPQKFQQMAGLTVYYNARQFHYLYLTHDDGLGRILQIMSLTGEEDRAGTYPLIDTPVVLPPGMRVELGVDVEGEALQFRYRLPGGDWTAVGPVLDASVLSDEAGRGDGVNFTGTFVGMACQDVSGRRRPADFSVFRYAARSRVQAAQDAAPSRAAGSAAAG